MSVALVLSQAVWVAPVAAAGVEHDGCAWKLAVVLLSWGLVLYLTAALDTSDPFENWPGGGSAKLGPGREVDVRLPRRRGDRQEKS